jgi:hypothetical protein
MMAAMALESTPPEEHAERDIAHPAHAHGLFQAFAALADQEASSRCSGWGCGISRYWRISGGRERSGRA